MPNVVGNQDEVMRQGASREDQVKIIQRGPCFFEIGFQHRKDFSRFQAKRDDFNGILDEPYLSEPEKESAG